MKALRFYEPGKVAVVDVRDPEPGPGDAVLRVHATGLCNSDVRVYLGEKKAAVGVVPGHEMAGEIVARVGAVRLTAYASTVASVLCIGQWLLLAPWEWPRVPAAVYALSLLNGTLCTVAPVLMTPPASPSREDRRKQFMGMFRTIGSPGFPATEAEIEALADAQVDRAPYNPAGVGRQMVAIMSSEPRHELLAGVRCPALVLHGADDPLVPLEGGKDTAASIPGAELVVIPGMGHDFTEALMPQFLTHVGGFLSRVQSRAEAA